VFPRLRAAGKLIRNVPVLIRQSSVRPAPADPFADPFNRVVEFFPDELVGYFDHIDVHAPFDTAPVQPGAIKIGNFAEGLVKISNPV
jgi:hypothetical protein